MTTYLRAPIQTPLVRRGRIAVHDVLNGNLLLTTLAAPAQAPFRQLDWPNPTTRKKPTVELLTWVRGLSPGALLSPFVPSDLPNPGQKGAFVVEDYTWLQSFGPGVLLSPFVPQLWNNPPQRGQDLREFSWKIKPIPATSGAGNFFFFFPT